jgi:hypothetical protein
MRFPCFFLVSCLGYSSTGMLRCSEIPVTSFEIHGITIQKTTLFTAGNLNAGSIISEIREYTKKWLQHT